MTKGRMHPQGVLMAMLMAMGGAPAAEAGLTHGPLLGAVSDSSALIWVRTEGP